MRARRAVRASLACALVALLAAACGSGSDTSNTSDGGTTQLKVGIMPIVDDAAFFIAQKRGFFADEGLSVDPVTIQGGAAGIPKLQSGALDFSWGNYVSTYLAHAKGLKMTIVAEGYNAENDTLLVMAMPDSGITKPKDLKGKTVAVNTLGNVGTLTVKSVLKSHGVDPKSVNFVELAFPDMATALETGEVDAAWMVEPFITQVQTKLGAVEVLDSASGATEGFPIAGFFATQKYSQENPKTVAKFRRAYQRAQKIAAKNRSAVEEIVPSYTKIKPKTAGIMTIAKFPTTNEESRVQRVADLMYSFGVIDKKLDAGNLLMQQK